MALDKGTTGKSPAKRKRKRTPPRSQTPAPRSSSPPPPPKYGRERSVERPGSSSQVRNPRPLRSYPFLSSNQGINWRDVNPKLLSILNKLGRTSGEIITITSGFRTHAEQRYLYEQYLAGNIGLAAPPGRSNHESGNAIDAVVNGTPIASAFGEDTLNRAGLKSLAHLNDAVHVELIEGGGSYTPPAGGGTPAVSESAGSYEAPPPSMVPTGTASEYTAPDYAAEPTEAAVLPFEVNPDEQPTFLSPQQRSETWQLIANLPGASPETQQLARLARFSIGG